MSLVELRNCPSPAKLNLYLHVLARREDGYHSIETVFDLIDLQDSMSFAIRSDGAIVRRGGIHGLAHDNDLAVRAARLLAAACGTRFGVDIDIIKRIPVGGGLGGGSSNAATTLLALNRLWGVDWSVARLARLGLQLGADVPVFIHGTPALAEGIGERITPIALPTCWYVVVAPPAIVPTTEIFGAPELTRDTKPLKLSGFSRGQFGALGKNDLESVACHRYPPVARALSVLTDCARKVIGGSASRSEGKKSPRKGTAKAEATRRAVSSEADEPFDGHRESVDGRASDAGVAGAAVHDLQPMWRQARMSGSGACVFFPVADRDSACRIRDLVAAADVGKCHAVASLSRHPLRNWAFGRR